MKKLSTFFCSVSVLFSMTLSSQVSTETFETEVHNSNTFTDNGVLFNIITNNGGFDIQANYPNTGWNGSAKDNRYIDNSGSGNVVTNPSFSIKTTSNLFRVNRFWVFLSDNSLIQTNINGNLKVVGKLNGVTKFSTTKTTGFNTDYNPNTSNGTNNGFTLIDLTNLNGQNYSNIIIDELELTSGGVYTYMQLDAFQWVKNSNVLSTTDLDNWKDKFTIYPNPVQDILKISTEEKVSKINVFSMTGAKVLSADETKEINVSKLEKGNYIIEFIIDDNTKSTSKFIKK